MLVVFLLELMTCKPPRAGPKLFNHCPPSYPIIGCLLSFYKNRRRLLDWYTEMLSQSPTSTILVQRLGARRTIITANPKNVEYMLKTNFKNYPKGKPFTDILGDFLGSGIFNVDGELWWKQRKLASHEFSTNSLRDYAMNALRKEVKNELLPALELVAEDGQTVDLQDLLKRLTFNLICKVSLGIDPCSLDLSLPNSPLAKAFDISSEICARRGAATLLISWKIKRWLGVGSERNLREAVQEIHTTIGRAIHEKIKKMDEKTRITSTNRLDLLSRLISAGYDEEIIRDMAISFIVAGRDTTSAAMTWLFWLLSCHPDIEQGLLREIELVAKGNELDYESLSELRLLDACLYESMRLYPPVAWDSKHAISDDSLPDGTLVKSGDRVTYFPYGMGRMEALWGKDPLEFKPSRWLSEAYLETSRELKKVSPFKFPIFQAGPRDCIGKQMAFVQMKYVVASILRRFDIKPVDEGRPVFVPMLTAHMAGGFQVSVHKRV
ncbi:hypothetical protein CDL15_Pgr022254 [Punica granatum]|nr:hypothetical protein CDL15_Pgr022254 [Punica granatum]